MCSKIQIKKFSKNAQIFSEQELGQCTVMILKFDFPFLFFLSRFENSPRFEGRCPSKESTAPEVRFKVQAKRRAAAWQTVLRTVELIRQDAPKLIEYVDEYLDEKKANHAMMFARKAAEMDQEHDEKQKIEQFQSISRY